MPFHLPAHGKCAFAARHRGRDARAEGLHWTALMSPGAHAAAQLSTLASAAGNCPSGGFRARCMDQFFDSAPGAFQAFRAVS